MLFGVISEGSFMINEFSRKIYSKEKNTGKGMYIAAVFFSLPVLGIAAEILVNQSDFNGLFIALPFAVFALLLFVIGKYQQKKYERLGKAPLTITPSVCTIGEKTSGSITIQKENFNKVQKLILTCLRMSSAKNNTNSTTTYTPVWTCDIEPVIHFSGGETKLEFTFMIPTGSKPTSGNWFKANKFHWELSFEYVETLDNIKRTWEIPVVEGYKLAS